MGRLLGMLLLLAGCNQLLGIDDVTAAQDPLRDTDGDGHPDIEDNCPSVPNPDQLDTDQDNRGDACDAVCSVSDPDTDQDGAPDNCDLCPTVPSQTQHDEDRDGVGDECDNCPGTANPGQEKISDADPLGDACDPTMKSAQSTLMFDAFAPYDPQKWTDEDHVWSIAPQGDAVISAAGASREQGLRGMTSLGTEPVWYVETALRLGPGLGSNNEMIGVGITGTLPGTFNIACEVLCKPGCQLFLERPTDSAKGSVVIAPGTYVLRLSGAQGDNMETRFSCELVGIDTITLHVMSVGMTAGAPAIFATAPTEFMYVHAVR